MRFLKFWPVLVFLVYIFAVYRPFIFGGRLPIPADTIVGLYYPWRDAFSDQYPNGIPFKNSLITDAVRQEYPWRQLAIEQLKQGHLPLWNPYSFSGYPLMANLQSAPFYSLNFVYWLADFPTTWSIQVILQTILGGLFMAIFLRNLKLSPSSAVLGTIAWVGCGFFISWLETNMVVQSVIWLPLILYCLDRLNSPDRKWWLVPVFIFSIVSTILAGHLQTIFYVMIVAGLYAFYRAMEKHNLRSLIPTGISILLALLITSPVLIPAFQFIQLSGRSLDQAVWNKPDWFLPWQNLIQFIAPDFFGNPATLNYFGVWNYGEFVGYIGLVALFFGLSAIFTKRKEVRFFQLILVAGLILILPTPIAEIPYRFNWPFIASSQPSRLIVIISFTLSVAAAFGLDWWQKENKGRHQAIVSVLFGMVISVLWLIAFKNHLSISLRNLVLPTAILATIILATASVFFSSKLKRAAVAGLLLLACFDSAKFAIKFLPFTPAQWLFPKTKIISYLSQQTKTGVFRVTSMEDQIFPDNYSDSYKIQTASGYDPLYLQRYAELMIAINRGQPDINPPFGYNRSITPRSYDKPLYSLLNVKYLLTPFELFQPDLRKVMQEGETRLYEVTDALPRAFFVERVRKTNNKQETITAMFASDFNPAKAAAVEDTDKIPDNWSEGTADIRSYQPNEVVIETNNKKDGFLVLTDSYYPTWKAAVDGVPAKIYLTDYAFRGIIVPGGEHKVRFSL
ncbi:YfhO family protein [Patescibacteria group bacterium]|nr:YfhO family protein [Patescibacteria group bacterium]